MAYVQAISELLSVIQPLAQPVEDALEKCWWIVTHNGDTGMEYCSDCCDKEVVSLREKYPDVNPDEIYGDGGWAIEHDHHCFCDGCGMRLEGILTDYAVKEEIDHFMREGFQCYDADEAFDIGAILDNYEYSSDEHRPEVMDAIQLGKKFIEGRHFQTVVQPCTWADDGGPAMD